MKVSVFASEQHLLKCTCSFRAILKRCSPKILSLVSCKFFLCGANPFEDKFLPSFHRNVVGSVVFLKYDQTLCFSIKTYFALNVLRKMRSIFESEIRKNRFIKY